MNQTDLKTVTDHYLMAALWSELEGNDDALIDIPDETRKEAEEDCQKFVEGNMTDIEECGMDMEHIGHNFWLTRNGHGLGFWDRGLEEELEKRLTKACEGFGQTWLYMGDDKKLYLM